MYINYIIRSRRCVRKEVRNRGKEVYIVDLVARLIGIIPCIDGFGGGIGFCRF